MLFLRRIPFHWKLFPCSPGKEDALAVNSALRVLCRSAEDSLCRSADDWLCRSAEAWLCRSAEDYQQCSLVDPSLPTFSKIRLGLLRFKATLASDGERSERLLFRPVLWVNPVKALVKFVRNYFVQRRQHKPVDLMWPNGWIGRPMVENGRTMACTVMNVTR